jgi:hypothetical protein
MHNNRLQPTHILQSSQKGGLLALFFPSVWLVAGGQEAGTAWHVSARDSSRACLTAFLHWRAKDGRKKRTCEGGTSYGTLRLPYKGGEKSFPGQSKDDHDDNDHTTGTNKPIHFIQAYGLYITIITPFHLPVVKTMPLTGGLAPHLGDPTATIDSLQTDVFENNNGHGHAMSDIDSEPEAAETAENIESDIDAPVPPHPLGIKPLGNKYLDSGIDAKTASGLFRALPDELLMHMFEGLDMDSLRALGSTCRFLYASCTFDELWKSLALE